jgi:serine/threonine-protein kinase PpkA
VAIPGYRILRKIRQGGMSTVYLATQKSVGREVALKVMSPTLSSDPSFGSRFYREAKIVGQLSHPNIVSIYDVGSYKHYNYIAMDYLPGVPLQDKLEQGVSNQDALKITREIASALDYAHERGYIHRDIKPDNILFRNDGSSVLCDFGIAKARKTSMKMTNVGSVLGTPHYMSPEQAQGKSVDGRSDLYGLGVVLFEMLTGQAPYQGEEPVAVAVKHISAPIPKLPANLRLFQPLINKLLAKKPANRYQEGKDIIEAIDVLEGKAGGKSSVYLTQTSSTAVQVAGLLGALFTTLSAALMVGLGKLFLNKKRLSSNTLQLSKQQLEAIDSFVLDGESDEAKEHSQQLSKPQESQGTEKSKSGLQITALAIASLIALTVLAYLLYPQLTIRVVANELSRVSVTETSEQETDSQVAAVVGDVLPINRKNMPNNTDSGYKMTITSTPKDAKIRILNIKPGYEPEMLLQPGAYHIEVSANDYHSQKLWLNIVDNSLTEQVTLKPTRRLSPAGTIITEQLEDGSKGLSVLIIPGIGSEGRPIAVGRTEVSFAQYDKFANATGRPLPDDEGWGRELRPVINVSYADVLAYSIWLSHQTGSVYRLPNQEEWQHAARAGSDSDFWWGKESAEGKANCRSGCDSEWSKIFSSLTAPVASYPPNDYGLYDMTGNVGEWLGECKAWQDEKPRACTSALAAGGSHSDKLAKTTSNSFQELKAAQTYKNTGFRVLLEL